MDNAPEKTVRAAESYLEFLGDDTARRALLACSAAVTLDDRSAWRAIELVSEGNGLTRLLLRRVKGLGCVWQQWDGSWYVADDVRTQLHRHLLTEFSAELRESIRTTFADEADRRLAEVSPDGQLATYRARLSMMEAGLHRLATHEGREVGAEQVADAWRQAQGAGKDATADAVDYLAAELVGEVETLPPQVLFLRGMAARNRGRKKEAETYFREVWQRGHAGDIYAIAAHLFGLLTRDSKAAERAFRDSLAWHDQPFHRAQVWHSLGNLLSRDRSRWSEAEEAYRQSLELRKDAPHQGQVWHSLGNLVSRDRSRWSEAEEAYRRSLELDPKGEGQAQVWHSLGNLVSRDGSRWSEAEEAYRRSLELDPSRKGRGQILASWANSLWKLFGKEGAARAAELAERARAMDPQTLKTRAVAARVLAGAYESQGKLKEAIKFYEDLRELGRQQRREGDIRVADRKIRELQARLGKGGSGIESSE